MNWTIIFSGLTAFLGLAALSFLITMLLQKR